MTGPLERLAHRFPALLVDTVAEHEPGKRLVALKNVTVNEDFFQGHFPHKPVLPAVLMVEALTQAATLLLPGQVQLRGVNNAKFRRQVIPGDQLKLVVALGAQRGPLIKAAAHAEVDGQIDVTTRDVSDAIGHGDQCEAEGKRDTEHTDHAAGEPSWSDPVPFREEGIGLTFWLHKV